MAVDEDIGLDCDFLAHHSFYRETTAIDYGPYAFDNYTRSIYTHCRLFFRHAPPRFLDFSPLLNAKTALLKCATILRYETARETGGGIGVVTALNVQMWAGTILRGGRMRRALLLMLTVGMVGCMEKVEDATVTEGTDTVAVAGSQAQLPADGRVQVTVTDSAIQLSSDAVQSADSGSVSFAVQNNSQGTNELTVRGNAQGEWKSGPIAPGSSVLMSLLLTPGSYELVWPAGGGLRKQITVN